MNDRQVDFGRLRLDWDERRTERLLAGVQAHIGRRRRVRRVALGSAALASLAGLGAVATRWNAGSTVASSAAEPAPARGAIRLAEGSEIGFDPATSAVRVDEQGPARVRVEAVRGPARYSVVPRPGRTFEVHSGSVTVRVVGTEFVVEPRGEATWVEVSRGKVAVSWGDDAGDQAVVAAGGGGLYPPAPAAGAVAGEAGAAAAGAPAPRGQPPTQVYRARVDRRDYRGAYAVLARNPGLAGDTVHDLLVAADVSRLSDHPAEAVPYLQRVLRDHPRDERAPLAAFTLGRTLSGLGRTREAMTTFGRVHSDWPRSPLAEDALVRQAEAASEIGDAAAARRLAAQYDRDHPNGRRRAEVRRYAGLE